MYATINKHFGSLLVLPLILLCSLFVSFFAADQAFADMPGTWKDKDTITVEGVDYNGPTTKRLLYDSGSGSSRDYQVFTRSGSSEILFASMNKDLDTVTTIAHGRNGTAENIYIETVNLTNTRASAPAAAPGGTTGGTPTSADTCRVDGVGWLVCPLVTFLSKITDGAYTAAEQLLIFTIPEPFSTDPVENPIYALWSAVRNLANIVFVIAFFAVIFSQATSMGISAYGIRKMLPRIVVAAILVNLSYYLCVFAIDLSNIIGAGLDGLLKALPAGAVVKPDDNAWEELGSEILAFSVVGATAVGVAFLATGTFFALLAFSFLAIMTAVVIFMARHALIIMLIILSPLAFVAYILPNTENLFDKWRKAFIAMLVMYPLVALLFAGSQVASTIMMSTAGGAGGTGGNMTWLYRIGALAVLAIPLFGIPWIVKFSGGFIGRVAGMVNDRSKGMVDRARNAGKEGAANRRGELRTKAAGNTFGRKLGYERNADGSVKTDENGNPIKKTGVAAWTKRRVGSVGRAAGGTASYAARRSGDKKYDLEQRKRESDRAMHEDLVHRLGETEEYQVENSQGEMITLTKPTAQAQKMAESAAGVGGQAGVERIQRLVSEQRRKELGEELGRQASDMSNAGGFSQGSRFIVTDSQGNTETHYDPGRALAEMGGGVKMQVTDQSGKTTEFDTTGERGLYGRMAAQQQAIKVGDGNAIEMMLYGKTEKDKDGNSVQVVPPLSDKEMASFSTFFGDNPGALSAKVPHLLKRDNAFTAVTAEQMAEWHGVEYKAAAARIRQLRASGDEDDAARAQKMVDAITQARREFETNENLKGKHSEEKDAAFVDMFDTIDKTPGGKPPVTLRGQQENYL